MDIQSVSMALSQIKTNQTVGTAVLSKAMDSQETMGNQIVNMIDRAGLERSVNPSVGSNFDVSV